MKNRIFAQLAARFFILADEHELPRCKQRGILPQPQFCSRAESKRFAHKRDVPIRHTHFVLFTIIFNLSWFVCFIEAKLGRG